MSTTPLDEKATILDCLNVLVRQRPGLDYGNYNPVSYRVEVRSIGAFNHVGLTNQEGTMTKAGERPLIRESEVTKRSGNKSRPIIISIEQGGYLLGFRLKGERRTYRLPTDWCFVQAVDAHVTAERARKKAERNTRKVTP